MITVGFIGSRGIVGSVLLNRMQEENDFAEFEALFFSTSKVGKKVTNIKFDALPYQDAYNIKALSKLDVILTCQGGEYTQKIYPQLRQRGWQGYWIDSSSALRLANDSIIVLDPINRDAIDKALANGIKNYIGGNCTVSLLLMAIAGLCKENLIDWLSVMTYQAASGAGAQTLKELITQMHQIGYISCSEFDEPDLNILSLDKKIATTLNSSSLAGNLIPWIDTDLSSGQSREEFKVQTEANKILQTKDVIPIDCICVRVPTIRCHSQALTIKLKKQISISEIEQIINKGNEWVKIIPNNKEATIRELTPLAVSGKLTIPIGRIRTTNISPNCITAFTVGDQLLWGAAEPLRRALKIILEYKK
ncbi:MAG: aspartate-semialdehyde dehydrogenase [Coxiella sp. DG_40]|nr:MAG: aspartate-semialdehyde dehydrogenase [Coxiella sp. DG_40]